jgi:hypothetical protein
LVFKVKWRLIVVYGDFSLIFLLSILWFSLYHYLILSFSILLSLLSLLLLFSTSHSLTHSVSVHLIAQSLALHRFTLLQCLCFSLSLSATRSLSVSFNVSYPIISFCLSHSVSCTLSLVSTLLLQ